MGVHCSHSPPIVNAQNVARSRRVEINFAVFARHLAFVRHKIILPA
jgi:hypothetical protein